MAQEACLSLNSWAMIRQAKRLIAAYTASSLGLNLYAIDPKTLPSHTGDFETFIRLWQRESMLMPLALYIDVDGASDAEKVQLKRLLHRSDGITFLDKQDPDTDTTYNRLLVEIMKTDSHRTTTTLGECVVERRERTITTLGGTVFV